jgi:hypothetical protein
MTTVTYEKLYSLPVGELDNVDYDSTESFIFQGSKNWDLYFGKTLVSSEISEFQNVSLLDFTEKKEFQNYLKNNEVIDYSIEHVSELNKYFVLVANHG